MCMRTPYTLAVEEPFRRGVEAQALALFANPAEATDPVSNLVSTAQYHQLKGHQAATLRNCANLRLQLLITGHITMQTVWISDLGYGTRARGSSGFLIFGSGVLIFRA